jgi:2-polyprenyl-3-methyl-5-hydroxy-6-metoxy-1,4-benzoquinol methylase
VVANVLSRLGGVEVSTERMSSAIAGESTGTSTSQQRYAQWRSAQQFPREYLLPQITRAVVREWPSYMSAPTGHAHLDDQELRARVQALGPWYVPFRVRGDHFTMNMLGSAGIEARERTLFRRDLIVGTVAAILGDDIAETTFLDVGCNCGFFSLDIADRGAKHVEGIDLRPENIAQAQFLADNYQLDNVTFRVSDADALRSEEQRDVVLNLGVLYHVVNPLQFMRQTYELCRRFAIIDTVVHAEPVSAYMLFGDKNVDHPAEGREEWEFHPTYRAAIDTIRYAGFSDVIEILGDADPPHPLYESGTRRCFLAIK